MSVTTQNNDTELKKLLSSPVKSSGGGDASPMHPPASPGGSVSLCLNNFQLLTIEILTFQSILIITN